MKLLDMEVALTLAVLLCSCAARDGMVVAHKGEVERIETEHGDYLQYIPKSFDGSPRVLMVAHGTVKATGPTALEWADRFIRRWLEFAEKNRTVVIAPAFDMHRYQSSGGYRALFGRDIGADEFATRAVDRLKAIIPGFDGRFYLYGHSAGAQFAVHYAVRHPERLHQVVLSAPGRYPYPDTSVPWPYGAGRMEEDLPYTNPDELRHVVVEPDFEGWIRATRLPITIVIGSDDTIPQPERPGQRGITRVDFARSWAEDMNELARRHGRPPCVKLIIIPGARHGSAVLTSACQMALKFR